MLANELLMGKPCQGWGCRAVTVPCILVSLVGSTLDIWGFIFTSIVVTHPLTHIVWAGD